MRFAFCHEIAVAAVCAVKKQRHIYVLLSCFLVLIFSAPAFGKSIEEQRKDYLAAKKALDTNQLKTFGKIANSLKDYPLYPYLRYEYLRTRLWKVKDEDMIHFLHHHSDLPMTSSLQTAWLKLLVKRGKWQTFLDNYTPQSDTTMQCYQLQARMKTHNENFLLEDIRSVWLAGKSLPSQCDPAFELLYKSDLMTNELVWERVRLSMQNNQTQLVNFLIKRLDPHYQKLARLWIKIHNNPYKYTLNPEIEDSPAGREIIMHGVMRLARKDIDKAVKRFDKLKDQYSFLPGEVAELERTLAVRAAKNDSPLAEQLLDQVDNYHVDDEVFHYRLKTALANQDWPLLKRWTNGEPSMPEIKLRWLYWHARALEETGDPDKAKEIFTKLAQERDYYGFLSADKINVPYQMNHYPLPENKEELDRIADLPAIIRAHELYILGMTYPARREWHHAINKMTSYQMQMAAVLATQWGWYDRAILTMARAQAYDDLVLRFPVIYEDLLDKYAHKHGLDPSWVYGLVRAESAFIEDVRSPAGAIGLMQVMPRTGRLTARNIGLKHFRTSKLKQAETNIPIGSAYMKQMLEKFNGNMVLATAAYNAGPHRVTKWLPKNGCEEPDVWVEQIPFNETRKYVSRVLYFANIYDWRLQNEIKPIKERMALVTSSGDTLVSNLSCTALKISDNRHVN